ncbi:MAG TPA: GAF domain-containing protein, partial [Chloroflexota bacterium]|nr:GAF domain-containing protein [Chloroflexota bacterium]
MTATAGASAASPQPTLAPESERDLLRRQLADRDAQLAAVSDVLRSIATTTGDLHDVLGAITERLTKLLGAVGILEHFAPEQDETYDWTAVVTYPQDSDVPEAQRYPALSQRRVRGLAGEYLGGRIMLERRTLLVDDAQSAEAAVLYPGTARLAAKWGARSYAAVPLFHGGETIGAIMAVRTEVKPFTASEVALLETFASQAAIAIAN